MIIFFKQENHENRNATKTQEVVWCAKLKCCTRCTLNSKLEKLSSCKSQMYKM